MSAERLAAIVGARVPGFTSCVDFLELRQLARWCVRCGRQRKRRLLDPSRFGAPCAPPV